MLAVTALRPPAKNGTLAPSEQPAAAMACSLTGRFGLAARPSAGTLWAPREPGPAVDGTVQNAESGALAAASTERDGSWERDTSRRCCVARSSRVQRQHDISPRATDLHRAGSGRNRQPESAPIVSGKSTRRGQSFTVATAG